MGRVKKGSKAQRKKLWEISGGLHSLVGTLRSVNIENKDTSYSSAIWSEVSLKLFGEDDSKHRHWLWVIWTKNRKGVRDFFDKESESKVTEEKHLKQQQEANDGDTEEENLKERVEDGRR